jgi:flagellum-specific peptidoglycan hydrolase FlgJ
MASEQQLERLRTVVSAAQASARTFGVPASVTLAQWIFESSWGISHLSLVADNCFGIKASQGPPPGACAYVECPTAEYENGKRIMVTARFRKYPSAIASFDDHAFLLAKSARYQRAMQCASDPTAFAKALQSCGYSTNPNYAAQLIQAIRDYNLTQYDIASATAPAAKETV